MLVEFRVKNFKSIKEEQSISLVANNDDTLNENCLDSNKIRLLKSAVIYGPNASGKSNILEALSVMQLVVARSAMVQPGSKLPISPFKLSSFCQDKPSLFEATFIHDDVRYQYGFTATDKQIYDEWLYAFPFNKAQQWVERSYDPKTGETEFKWSSYFKGNKKELQDMTRADSLYLSVGAQFNNKQLSRIYKWFNYQLRIIIDAENIMGVTAEMIYSLGEKNEIFKNTIINLLKKADMGIFDVGIEKDNIEKPKFPSNIPSEVKEMLLINAERYSYKARFYHECVEKQKPINNRFGWDEESKGTQHFFRYIGPWLDALFNGMIVVVDELDRSLHPFLTRKLIDLFHDPKVNRYGAQLIFNTHNTIFLDPELFRRDQIWFAEKNEEGATNLYPLSDYKPRKGEALQKGYLSGRYGAIPILEEFGIIG